MNTKYSAPFLLDDLGSRHIFAPFFHSDSKVSSDLPLRIETVSASNLRSLVTWDTLQLRWDECRLGEVACRCTWDQCVSIIGYDQLILCLSTGVHKAIVRVDSAGLENEVFEMSTDGKRGELVIPLSGAEIRSITLDVISKKEGQGVVPLNWFGLGCSARKGVQEEACFRFDKSWPGLLLENVDWSQPRFARGLLFDEAHLGVLRTRKQLPGWEDVFRRLRLDAESWLDYSPETQMGRFIPWSDGRYQRESQRSEELFFDGPISLALVGLVDRNPKMIQLALRYLMAFLHTPHWCPPENRIAGATWDSKCFQEENTVFHVALLADWLDAGLTRHAKELVRKCIWDKGLAFIERDLMKYEYMWGMNQGAWFCRARIMGGLMLENKWPRMGSYVDRAYEEMTEIMNRYVLPDGGTDEGVSYWGVTMHAVMMGILAFARGRSQEVGGLLPNNFDKVESYLATLSSSEPGCILPEGDTSTSCIPGDAVAILAGLFPGGVYSKLFAGSMREGALGDYMKQYLPSCALSFALGPEDFVCESDVVPVFSVLESTGHLTSKRSVDGHAVRFHFVGAKAYASHTHADKGGFVLEVDGEPVLIDRGVVRYDDDRSLIMRQTCYHNAITPVMSDESFADQASLKKAVIPVGTGDKKKLSAWIDLSHVWRYKMADCSRSVRSESPFDFRVVDQGQLRKAGRIAFHLQSLHPFEVESGEVILRFGGGVLRISTPWSESFESTVDGIDLLYRDVYHATWYSRELDDFSLETRISLEFSE